MSTLRSLSFALALGLLMGVGLGCTTSAAVRHFKAAPDSSAASIASDEQHEETAGAWQGERQVMVLLPGTSPEQWQRIDRDLRRAYGLETVFGWPMDSLGEVCMVYRLPERGSTAEMIARLAADRRLRGAQPIQRFRLLGAQATRSAHNRVAGSTSSGDARQTSEPFNDPYYNLQHSVTSLRLVGVHRRATGKGVRLAVIDTGIDVDHPELQGRISRARNFVDEGQDSFTSDVHGTAVAGVIAASVNNGIGIVGVAPGVDLLALKACWQVAPNDRAAVCNSYTLAKAFDFALREEVDVINLSLTGPDDPLLERLIDRAVQRGVVVIAAAEVGARAASESEEPVFDARFGFPASMPSVLAVRSSDLSERLSQTQGELQRGPSPGSAASRGGEDREAGLLGDGERDGAQIAREDLAAPGVDVLTTVPRDSYDFLSGSSLAAAHASGIAALLLEIDPEISPARVRDLLRQTGRAIGSSNASEALSVGRLLDACAAVEALLGESVCPK